MIRKRLPAVTLLPALNLAACQTGATPPGNPAEARRRSMSDAGQLMRSYCTAGAWVFTATTLDTAGEVSCTFNAITPTATGYTIRASCTAEAPPAPATLRLSYAQLLVEGGPFAPPGLLRCPQ